MRLVPCPECGPREQSEFVCMGEPLSHPGPSDDLADALYSRTNAKGPSDEMWWHRFGCRGWFRLRRDTATNAFVP